MRLINTNTELFEEFIGKTIPHYAILSRTWGEAEVSFKDMNGPSGKNKKEYRKIAMTCQLAHKAGLRYAWVDTCCIDKSSSAEPTEAMNSKFHRYQKSAICFVYLSHLPGATSLEIELPYCRWFTRGWTLQELIAPSKIAFFDQEWNKIGDKGDLMKYLAFITGVSIEILKQTRSLSTVAIAQKMSWSAHRQTSRVEDTAYCWLGIFGVHIPMLYGEEGGAFWRLQEAIIKTSPDFSIFAWKMPSTSEHIQIFEKRIYSGVLAKSPRTFSDSSSLKALPNHFDTDFALSNRGIKIRARVYIQQISGRQGFRYIFPACLSGSGAVLGIRFRKCGSSSFVREDPSALAVVGQDPEFWQGVPRDRYLLTELPEMGMDQLILEQRPHILQVSLPQQLEIDDAIPWTRWDDEDQLFFLPGDPKWGCGALRIKGEGRDIHIPLECMFFALGWAEPEVSNCGAQLLTIGR